MMLRDAFLACLAVLLCASGAPLADPVDELAAANAAYEAGRYDEALSLYEGLIAADLHHESVYYNLGCAAARLGRYGDAILAFRRALRYAPGHEDARANLEWVRARASESASDLSPARGLLERAAAPMPLDPALVTGVVLLYLAALLALLALARRGWARARLCRHAAFATGLVALLVLAPAFLQLWLRASDEGAVFIAPRVEARSGPADSHPTLFSAHEGLEVRVLDERGAWVRVAVPSGPNGWVPCSALRGVAPGRLACSVESEGRGPTDG